jgi:hypothetical protein
MGMLLMMGDNKKTYKGRQAIRKLFARRGIRYLQRSRVAWKPLLSLPLHRSPYYLENRQLFDDLNRRYGAAIEESRLAPLYIKQVDPAIGLGVFAASPIEKGTFIGEYTGVIQIAAGDSGEALDGGGYESDFSWYYVDDIEEAPDLEINGRLEGNELRFVNHSENPNVSVEHTLHKGQWVLFFVAERTIRKDEQLLISYGDAYWGDDCRKLVS